MTQVKNSVQKSERKQNSESSCRAHLRNYDSIVEAEINHDGSGIADEKKQSQTELKYIVQSDYWVII